MKIEKDELSIWSVESIIEDKEVLAQDKEFYDREEVDELLKEVDKKIEEALEKIEHISGIVDIDICRKLLEDVEYIIN